MKALTYRALAASALIAALLPCSAAHAQLGDLLNKGGAGGSGSSSGGLGSLGGLSGMLSGQSISSSSTSNIAGVLQYCIKNKFLNAGSASSVKDSLMSKLPGNTASSDSGYVDGAKGLLSNGDGKQIDLSGGGLKQQITEQICDKILTQAKSLL